MTAGRGLGDEATTQTGAGARSTSCAHVGAAAEITHAAAAAIKNRLMPKSPWSSDA
ncbi:hypothetical protein GCM10017620_34110 [Brevundimonas intermedia]|uniref:Uncharacterized protein n=1 Tax=Brevundimonas intermedia TaxID=74315 RepID=A0ABQ5TC76_9CAUL|nr:hypothetical protein GCM10017620_34110 [Brevundimonas intermedia]